MNWSGHGLDSECMHSFCWESIFLHLSDSVWNRDLQKLTVFQPIKKLSAFRIFI
jgi:hypothetical protein